MKYKLTIDRHIEARNAQFAEDSLIYDNGVAGKTILYTNLEEAEVAYKEAVKDLQAPRELSHGLYWYSGAMLEAYDDDGVLADLIYAEVKRGENE